MLEIREGSNPDLRLNALINKHIWDVLRIAQDYDLEAEAVFKLYWHRMLNELYGKNKLKGVVKE